MFTKDEIRQIVRDTAVETSRETLRGLGVDVDHPLDVQKDFAALRDWRLSMASIRRRALVSAIGVLATGTLAALWVGIKTFVK